MFSPYSCPVLLEVTLLPQESVYIHVCIQTPVHTTTTWTYLSTNYSTTLTVDDHTFQDDVRDEHPLEKPHCPMNTFQDSLSRFGWDEP